MWLDIKAPGFVSFCFAFKLFSKAVLLTLRVTTKQGTASPSSCCLPNLQCTPWHSQLYRSSHFQSPERKSRYVRGRLCAGRWVLNAFTQFALPLFPLGSYNQQVRLSLTPCTRLLSYAEPFFTPAETFVLRVVLGAELCLLGTCSVIHSPPSEIHGQLTCFLKFFELNLAFYWVTRTQSTPPFKFKGISVFFR